MILPKKCQTTPESKLKFEQVQNEFINSHPMLKEAKIVSLGCDCSVRSILTTWGLKPTKEMGEVTYPFDLAYHDHIGMLKVLSNNFDGFFESLTFNKEMNLWENKNYGFVYNHDEDCGENDLEKFSNRFKNRVNNFYNMLNQDTPVIFVAYASRKLKAVYKIFDQLKKMRNGKSHLVILSEKRKFFTPKDIDIIYVQKPFNDYIWWKDEMRYSEGGLSFEYNIVNKFYKLQKKIIKNKFKLG